MKIPFKDQYLDLNQPVVMGVLNVTPDSFADGGLYYDVDAAVARARVMAEEGAAIIDIGAESTRPGAKAPSIQEELDRLMPVLEKLVGQIDAMISVDTRRPEIITAAIEAGVDMINSVDSLSAPGALTAVAESTEPVALCLMHMRGQPSNMQKGDIVYHDIVQDISQYLNTRLGACVEAGIDADRIVIDPGFGFGKTPEQNCIVTKHLADFKTLGQPILFGCSRKSTLGLITGKTVDNRLAPSLAGAIMACLNGANIVRVHDVVETVDALKTVYAILASDK